MTSSPVSDQSTPRHAVRQRHSTASTMSSPNMSPIKPLPTVQETPTSARRRYLSRQSLSPVDCSSGVLESSGIDIKGDILPDLSPIKAIGQAGKSVNGRLCNVNRVSFKLTKKKCLGSGYDNKRFASLMFEYFIAFFLESHSSVCWLHNSPYY